MASKRLSTNKIFILCFLVFKTHKYFLLLELTVANFSHFNNSGLANSALGRRDTDKIQADRELEEVRIKNLTTFTG